jgi:8-oxo-(d)GTP phosphatase
VTTVHLVRHAHAGDRSAWTADDLLRPLSPKGRKQSAAIAERLAPLVVRRLLSSPSVRCLETLEPLAAQLGIDVEPTAVLAEGADPRDALALIEGLDGPAALCSHGDVIPGALVLLARRGVPLVDGHELRDGDLLRNAKASTWDLDVEAGTIVRGTYVPPPGKT